MNANASDSFLGERVIAVLDRVLIANATVTSYCIG
jgi:hypothetical protein